MKECFKCGKWQPLSDFYKHPMMGDGHLNKCKTCTRKDVAERVGRLGNNPEWLAKERERCRIKQQRYREIGVAAPVTKETRKRWIEKNKHKIKAHVASSNAVRSGKLERKTACEKCGATGDIEKHHPDYSKPLLVEWLCTKCHGLTRRKS